MPKRFTVTLPIYVEAEVEAANAADAVKAISHIIEFGRYWNCLVLRNVNVLSWYPTVDRHAMADKHCITLNRIDVYADVGAEEITAAAATA
jgi:hypothetical protein